MPANFGPGISSRRRRPGAAAPALHRHSGRIPTGIVVPQNTMESVICHSDGGQHRRCSSIHNNLRPQLTKPLHIQPATQTLPPRRADRAQMRRFETPPAHFLKRLFTSRQRRFRTPCEPVPLPASRPLFPSNCFWPEPRLAALIAAILPQIARHRKWTVDRPKTKANVVRNNWTDILVFHGIRAIFFMAIDCAAVPQVVGQTLTRPPRLSNFNKTNQLKGNSAPLGIGR